MPRRIWDWQDSYIIAGFLEDNAIMKTEFL